MKRKLLSPTLILALLLAAFFPSAGAEAAASPAAGAISVDAPSAILIEAGSGEILYEKDAYTHRSPASVTKLMTMLLAAEAVDNGKVSLEDTITASPRAASMGGSQIWLEEGETMSFGEALKCVTVVSANDCCVAIAEHLSGSEETFVNLMNARAAELGLENTHFLCCSGLSDSDEHYSCAYDLAMIGRELLRHDFIRDYTTIWIDSIRGGEFMLSNTNKLIYHYKGATGLKTGYTSKALHCLAASAQRDGAEYIAVVLGAPSSASRFAAARTLLDYAFANYSTVSPAGLCTIPVVELRLGKKDCLSLALADERPIPVKKELSSRLEAELCLPEKVSAPVEEGQEIGTLRLSCGGELIREIPVLAAESVEKKGLWDIFLEITSNLL